MYYARRFTSLPAHRDSGQRLFGGRLQLHSRVILRSRRLALGAGAHVACVWPEGKQRVRAVGEGMGVPPREADTLTQGGGHGARGAYPGTHGAAGGRAAQWGRGERSCRGGGGVKRGEARLKGEATTGATQDIAGSIPTPRGAGAAAACTRLQREEPRRGEARRGAAPAHGRGPARHRPAGNGRHGGGEMGGGEGADGDLRTGKGAFGEAVELVAGGMSGGGRCPTSVCRKCASCCGGLPRLWAGIPAADGSGGPVAAAAGHLGGKRERVAVAGVLPCAWGPGELGSGQTYTSTQRVCVADMSLRRSQLQRTHTGQSLSAGAARGPRNTLLARAGVHAHITCGAPPPHAAGRQRPFINKPSF